MFRKYVAITLAVSAIAMVSSGLLMMLIDKPSFSLRVHPIHFVFGCVMTLSVIAHMALNAQSILRHLRTRAVTTTAIILVTLLASLYWVAAKVVVPEEIAQQLDAVTKKAEQESKIQFR